MEVFQFLSSGRKESKLVGEKIRSSLVLQETEKSSLRTRKFIRVRPGEMNFTRSTSQNSNTLKRYDICLQNPIKETLEDVLPLEQFKIDKNKLEVHEFDLEDIQDAIDRRKSMSIKYNRASHSRNRLNESTTKIEGSNTYSSSSRGSEGLTKSKGRPLNQSAEICASNLNIYNEKNAQDMLSIPIKDQSLSLNSSQADWSDADKSLNLRGLIGKNFFPISPSSQINRQSSNIRKSRFSRVDTNTINTTPINSFSRKVSMALAFGEKETTFSEKE